MASLIQFGFQGKNTRAQRAAARYAARMVTRVTSETQAAIRAIIVRAIDDGIPPLDAARLIRQIVGLTSRQALAVATYRSELINSGLSLARVDLMLERYIAKKIRDRAKSIARTEIMGALNRGKQEGYREAQREGLLRAGATKEIITTPDERLCQLCGRLDGQRVPLAQKFSTGDMTPPFHPMCRCTMVINP